MKLEFVVYLDSKRIVMVMVAMMLMLLMMVVMVMVMMMDTKKMIVIGSFGKPRPPTSGEISE